MEKWKKVYLTVADEYQFTFVLSQHLLYKNTGIFIFQGKITENRTSRNTPIQENNFFICLRIISVADNILYF